MRAPATETDDIELLRLRAMARAKAEAEAGDDIEDFSPEEAPKSFPGGSLAAAAIGGVKAIPILGSNIEELVVNAAASDPLRGEAIQSMEAAPQITAEQLRALTRAAKEERPLAYGAGGAASLIAQLAMPGSLLAKAPRALRLIAGPAIGAGTAYLERPEGESLTPEQNIAARKSQAVEGAIGGAFGQALAEVPSLLKFGSKAARKAYEATRPEKKARLLDIGFEQADVPEEIGREIIESGALKGLIAPSREKMLRRIQESSRVAGEDIGEKIKDIEKSGVAASPLDIMSRFSMKARPMAGVTGFDKETKALRKAEAEFLNSTSKLLRISPEARENAAKVARDDVRKWAKTLTSPVGDDEVQNMYNKFYQRRLVAAGELAPTSVQKIKSAVQGRLQREYETPPAMRTDAQKTKLRIEGAKQSALSDTLLEMAERGGGRKQELSRAMKKYGNLERAESNLEKAVAKKSLVDRYGGLGVAGLGAGLLLAGENIDSPELRLIGLLGSLGGAYGLARGPQTSAKIYDTLSNIKPDPLKFGLMGQMAGRKLSPWSLMQTEEQE